MEHVSEVLRRKQDQLQAIMGTRTREAMSVYVRNLTGKSIWREDEIDEVFAMLHIHKSESTE